MLRDPNARRNWPPRRAAFALAALAVACSGPKPIERTTDDDVDTVVDASVPLAAPTWCNVQAILASKCQRCHGAPTRYGAPFALVSYDDTQLTDKKGRPRFERIAKAIEQRSMPAQSIELEPPVEPLREEERTTILAWCAQGGMLTGSASCEPAR